MTIPEYLSAVNGFYKSGISAAHTFREALSRLIESLTTEITVTGKPELISSYVPDYILTKRQLPVGYVEVKDVREMDPKKRRNEDCKGRFERYKTSLENLLFTDYLDFYLYREGKFVTRVVIGRVEGDLVLPIHENFNAFENIIRDFATYTGRLIDNTKALARILAEKACLLQEVIHTSIKEEQVRPLEAQMERFRQLLARDTTVEEFAEIYASIVVIGIFMACLDDRDLQDFSRQEVTVGIPKSNSFLAEIFSYTIDPDNGFRWVVDDLRNIFRHCNTEDLLRKSGEGSGTEKSLTPFYETFLREYNLRQRKNQGESSSQKPVNKMLKTLFGWPGSLTYTDRAVWNARGNKIPDSFFISENGTIREEYQKGVSVTDLFLEQGTGIAGKRKSLFTAFSKKQFIENPEASHMRAFHYSIFDIRYINDEEFRLPGSESSFLKNLDSENLLLSLVRHSGNDNFILPFITSGIVDEAILSATEKVHVFPLYLYPESPVQFKAPGMENNFEKEKRRPNLNMEIVRKIGMGMGLAFIPEEEIGNVCFANNNTELRDDFKQVFAPSDLLDYLYAVLYSPNYRNKNKGFLKIDFPKIPYPQSSDIFWQLAKLGGALRRIHLMESPAVRHFNTTFPVKGANQIEKPYFVPDKELVSSEDYHLRKQTGKVYINSDQYFSAVPRIAWDIYIGGYQPARKWLRDRDGQVLTPEDIQHYQQIIVALTETHQIMRQIGQLPIC